VYNFFWNEIKLFVFIIYIHEFVYNPLYPNRISGVTVMVSVLDSKVVDRLWVRAPIGSNERL
jgi:hypothetical protein